MKCLPDVAQVLDGGETGQPRGIVGEHGTPLRRKGVAEVAETLELGTHALEIGGQGFGGEEVALFDLPPGSPIMPVAPPATRTGRCPPCWIPAKRALLQQMTDVQAVRRRVEAGVDGDRRGAGIRGGRVEALEHVVAGDLLDQPSEAEVLGKGGGAHNRPHTTGRALSGAR